MRGALVIIVAVAACSGEISATLAIDAADAGVGGAVILRAPADGATLFLDTLDDVGSLAAAIDVEVAASGVDELAILVDGQLRVGERVLLAEGQHTITVVGRDVAGAVVGMDTASVTVTAPALERCQDWLSLYQLDFSPGPARAGVADPVTVRAPINGVRYRYLAAETPRESLFMSCELALSLARAAPLLRARDLVEVVDLGIYNYRCIGGGTPPDCPRGMSQHALANAIDIAGVVDAAGQSHSVLEDWQIDTEGTCVAATEPGSDTLLHELICALKAAGVWNIVLTPNYNADHRDHFHVDLTEDGDFLRHRRPVDHGPDHH